MDGLFEGLNSLVAMIVIGGLVGGVLGVLLRYSPETSRRLNRLMRHRAMKVLFAFGVLLFGCGAAIGFSSGEILRPTIALALAVLELICFFRFQPLPDRADGDKLA